MNRSEWIALQKKLLTIAVLVLSVLLAYEIYATALEFFDKGSTSISAYTLITFIGFLVVSIKLIQIIKN